MDNIKPKTILLTAFEPSGDALGAMATAGLKEIDSNIRVVGLGGSLMESAGVELLEHTTKEAAMGVGALAEIKRIKRLVDVVDAWIKENNPDVVVAIDSPAANWPVCKVARKHGCSVLHLAGPKLWAWAPWRIKKMKRLSDHVMCLLPFEPEWFESRGMPATFIGHPAMKKNVVEEMQLPTGSPRIVLLPGSRKSEIQKNLPMQQEILRRITIRFPHATAAIACRSEDVELVQLYSNDVHIVSDALPTVLEWANLALCVSGTVSLHVMNHATPMIGMYKVNAFSILLAKMLLNTPHRLLPNIIAGTQIVPEFIPCLECASTIAEVAIKLLSNEESMHAIQSRLQKEAAIYAEHNPSKESAELILSFTQ